MSLLAIPYVMPSDDAWSGGSSGGAAWRSVQASRWPRPWTAAVAIFGLGQPWVGVVELLRLALALPCAAMTLMRMTGMNRGGQTVISQPASRAK